jgi:competence protein ComEC
MDFAYYFKNYKTELFLLSSILFGSLNIQNIFLHILLSLIILKLFINKKEFIIFSVIIALIITFFSFSTLIINKTNHYGSIISYKTTKGILKTKKEYDIGSILIGKFKVIDKKFYKIIKSDGKLINVKLPYLQEILKFRKDFSDRLYFISGGKLTLPQALLLGDKSYLDSDTKDMFTLLGLNHLLAVSGMHVGLLVLIIYLICRGFHPKIRYLIISLFLINFLFLAGLKIPVIRSVIFSLVIMLALFFDIKVNIKKFILFLAAIFILISPSTIHDISFILSFMAVFGIIYMLENDKSKIYSLVLTGVVATAFTLPAVLYFFGMFNILSILNTIVLLPFIYLMLTTALFGLIFTKLSIAPLIFLENLINFIVSYLSKISGHFFILNKIGIFTVIIMIIILLVSIYFKKIRLVLIVLLIPFLPLKHENGIFIPAFSRSKSIIELSNENKIYFMGSHSDFRYKLLPYLAELNVRNFDYGKIKIFGGKNYFINVKNKGVIFDDISINKKLSDVKYVYLTKSNSINSNNKDYDKKYIIYKNKFRADNIIELKKSGNLIIKKNGIIYENKD